MGVPGIHLEQTFSPFGEKPGGPFFIPVPRAGRRICGGAGGSEGRNDEKCTDISHHRRAKADNRGTAKIVYNDAENG